MFQLVLAGVVAFVASNVATLNLIRYFSAEGLGQEIREDGPRSHLRKRGTPTMGGIAILGSLTLGYVVANLVGLARGMGGFTASGVLVLGLTLALAGVGFADDIIKIVKGRNLGLHGTAKLLAQLVIALVFGGLILLFPNAQGIRPGSTYLSLTRDIPVINVALGGAVIGTIIFLIFVYFLIAAWSNAVNLTDGLDGLSSGTLSLALSAYILITSWQHLNSCSATPEPGCYTVRDPLDLAILATAAVGALLGFLWWNASPAKIFMGDTGSLALGGLVAGLSIASRTELLMVIIGAVFVMEAASVVIQVVSFKSTGKRVFKMSPFHHHFEQVGWKETAVVVRFWIMGAIAAAIGLAVFFGDWFSLDALGA